MAARRSPLRLRRAQIVAFRRATQTLDDRLPSGVASLRRAAWAGLQDSMPRAALLSLHARVAGTTPSTWEAPSLVQLWGPRYSAYVVDGRDAPVFTLARLPDTGPTRRAATELADRLAAALDDGRMAHSELARLLREPPNRLRYATLTGRIRMRWDGARQPTLWVVPPPDVGAAEARLELARRYLHVFGPASADAFAAWAGMSQALGATTFDALRDALIPVRTPIGDAWLLETDEPLARQPAAEAADVRLLPSGDPFFLFQRPEDRALLVDDEALRVRLWTPRVWPGALLVGGELAGTWRRADAIVSVEPWRRLSRAERDAVEAEAASLPLPGLDRRVVIDWRI